MFYIAVRLIQIWLKGNLREKNTQEKGVCGTKISGK